ncbi:MAG: 7-cyano-7-deazaguanine synthase [Acidobacteria bacterium]|nr:7-cyano-7-deazaguanine synthase [Acidobacteriota bacterium]
MTLVLLSGGLDSAVLLAHESREHVVHPLFVSVGLAWEWAELRVLDRLLAAPVFAGRVRPLSRAELTMRDVYSPSHWAIRGTPPAYDTPDEAVYLAGRNLVLLTKAGVVAAERRLQRIALAPLAGNPFPDARPEFFAAMERSLTLGLDHPVTVVAPFLHRQKADIIMLGRALGVPLELTLSCMSPCGRDASDVARGTEGAGPLPIHCGRCSKCRERKEAFGAAGVRDPTPYATDETIAGDTIAGEGTS